jgi:porphobilinogen deaminase
VYKRQDLNCVEFRGNVETRIKKIESGIASATLLAAAGIERLGMKLDVPHKFIPITEFIPAIGQGIVCIMAKRGSIDLTHINHQPSYIAATAERAVLKAFGGNCYSAISAHATIRPRHPERSEGSRPRHPERSEGSRSFGYAQDDVLELSGFVASDDGSKNFTKVVTGNISDAEKLGWELGKELLNWHNDFNNQTN